ncbi:MAG: hypothetical protein HQK54_02175 [Oligoflexales bacterium]|nr:hypothetical protein [Oligoflexales bacterium]
MNSFNKLVTQVWRPFLDFGPNHAGFKSDINKVRCFWSGENRVFLLPGLKRPIRWHEKMDGLIISQCAIPAITFNSIEIFHYSKGGYIYPRIDPNHYSSEKLPEKLYVQWLDTSPIIKPVNKRALGMCGIPILKNGEISFLDGKPIIQNFMTDLIDGVILPIKKIDETKEVIEANFNDEDLLNYMMTTDPNGMIVPELNKLKKFEMVIKGNRKVLFKDEATMRTYGIFSIEWPAPFCCFFPKILSPEILFHHVFVMRRCLWYYQNGHYKFAKRVAENWVQLLCSTTSTGFEHAWLGPRLSLPKEVILEEAEYSLGIKLNENGDFNRMINSNQYNYISKNPVSVNWSLGWLGFFWKQLLDDITEQKGIKFCELCGRILYGKRSDARFCSKEDNPECRQKYDSLRQRQAYIRNGMNEDFPNLNGG